MAARIVELEDEVQPAASTQNPVLFIATPAYGCMLTVQYLQCLLQTQLALAGRGIGIVLDHLGNESLITRARNLLTKRFLLSPATHLLFIDADISWDPEAILRLLKKDEGVTSTSYPKKFIDWKRLEDRVAAGDGEPLHQAGLDFNLNVTEKEVQVVDGFAKVLDAATGFMLVKREVVEKMYAHYEKELLVVNDLLGAQQTIKDYVAIFDCMIDPITKRSLSEDFAFSRRWQAMGGDVYMDLVMPLGHTGGFHYEGAFANRLLSASGRQELLQPAATAPEAPEPVPAGANERRLVLFAILPTDDKVSLGFVMSLTKLVAALQSTDKYVGKVKIFPDRNNACDFMWQQTEYSSMVFLDCSLGFEPDLVLDMLASASPFEAGVYPKPQIDWGRMESNKSQETVRGSGLQYELQLASQSAPSTDGKTEAISCQLGIAKLDRCVLERLNERMDPRATYSGGKKRLWFHEGVHEDRRLTEDELFCRMWGSGVTLNTKHQVTLLGNMTFVGVVMARKQIR